MNLDKVKPGDLGIVGDPVEHSLSPAMQTPALRDWWKKQGKPDETAPTYHKFPVRFAELKDFIQAAKAKKMLGLNITIPHKVSACLVVDEFDPFAVKVGSVNTIKFEKGRAKGYSTDAYGFAMSLEKDLGLKIKGETAFVIGTGGAGSVIINKLVELGAARVWYWNRTKGRSFPGMEDVALKEASDESEIKEASDSTLIVNTTSVGMREGDSLPLGGITLNRGQYIFDIVYNRETELLHLSRAVGAHTTNGLGMLLYQGAKAFEIWTGAPAPIEIMRKGLKTS